MQSMNGLEDVINVLPMWAETAGSAVGEIWAL